MKDIAVSARLVSGTVGLVVCYSLSIYLFWDSQISWTNFRVDPEHSRFTRFLYPFTGREAAKPIGILVAFLSVHLSWGGRYLAGDLIEKLMRKAGWLKSSARPAADTSPGGPGGVGGVGGVGNVATETMINEQAHDATFVHDSAVNALPHDADASGVVEETSRLSGNSQSDNPEKVIRLTRE